MNTDWRQERQKHDGWGASEMLGLTRVKVLRAYLPMISLTFVKNRGIFPSVIRRIQKSGRVGTSSHWASGLYKK